ncbi:MAG: calpain family cysteine protease [archaeon]|nr:calpain family cysteine protease [archaeon]
METLTLGRETTIHRATALKFYPNDKDVPQGVLFTDPNFPPNKNSIEGRDSKGIFTDAINGPIEYTQTHSGEVEWKRASDIFKGKPYYIFEGEIEPNDIIQGELGDCYFLSSLAALAEFPYLVYDLFFYKKTHPEGYFEIKVYIDGRQRVVVIDDYFPTKKSTGLFIYSTTRKNELWVPILEKVWAKVNGGYANIIGGRNSEVFPFLTGSFAEKFDLKNMSKDDIWNLLNTANEMNSIMGVSTEKSDENVGIIGGHAYTLLDTYTLKRSTGTVRMLKIRNPHATNEWTGAWSDSSSTWTKIQKETLGLEIGDDGIFFMQLEDFIKYFNTAYIGYITFSGNVVEYAYYTTDQTYRKGHVYTVYLPEDGQFTVTLFKPYYRFHRELVGLPSPATLIMAQIDKQGNVLDFKGNDCEYGNFYCGITGIFKKGIYTIYSYYEPSTIAKQDEQIIKFESPLKYLVTAFEDLPEDDFPYLKDLLYRSLTTFDAKDLKLTSLIAYSTHDYRNSGIALSLLLQQKYEGYELHAKGKISNANSHIILSPFKADSFDFYIPYNGYEMVFGISNVYNSKSSIAISVSGSYSSALTVTTPKTINRSDYELHDIDTYTVDYNTFYDKKTVSLSQAKSKYTSFK